MGFPSITDAEGSPVVGLGPGKPLALIAYLAVRREARREELVDLLWGTTAEANARNAFRQALHRLRTALGEASVPQDRDRVVLAEAADIRIDRDDLLAALERHDTAAIIELYRGDFLEGFEVGESVFDSWVDAERVRLRARFQVALQKGAEGALAGGRWLEALRYVQRLSTAAPFDEDVAILEANVLVAAGRGGEALGSLRRFTQVLREQLDLDASVRVRELIGRLERSDARAEAVSASPAARKPLPFVGREEELGRLMAAVRELASERGSTLLIHGDAGIGKSRLVDELVNRARAVGPMLVLRGRERAGGAPLPYASVAEALRAALKAPGIAGTGRHLLAEAARILPELRDSFELPTIGPVEDEGGRLRFFEGVAALLDSAAYEQPIVVVLDDVHNASPSTLDLVAYLGARLQSSPVCLILIAREESGSAATEKLAVIARDLSRSAPNSGAVRVPPLPKTDVVTLIDAIATATGAAGQLDVDRVAAACDGNPLRAIDLSRRAMNGELPQSVPETLREILWTRLRSATPSQRRVFFAVALVQRRVALRLVAAAAHLPEPAAFEAATALEQVGLLTQDGNGFVVSHDFTGGFVLEASGLAGRALLAGWAADALAAEPGASHAELSHLYSLSGRQQIAFVHARQAAYDAASLGTIPEVHRLLGLALAMAPDAASRAEIDRMLAAFGSGHPLLAPPTLSEEGPPPAEISVSPSTPDEQPQRAAPRQPRQSLATPRLLALISLLVLAVALWYWRRSATAGDSRRMLADSLLVVERGHEAEQTVDVISGPLASIGSHSPARIDRPGDPHWLRDLVPGWIHPTLSPDRQLYAVERMTDSGTDVYLVTTDTLNRVAVAVGGGSDIVLGWSPDGSNLLVRRAKTLADGGFDADLWAYHVDRRHVVGATPIDTSSTRSVREASWSPDGTRIAFVAQSGPTHQQDIFLVRADGRDVTDLTNDPAEDYHISWSSDGTLLAFTSDRRGNPDIFAYELEEVPRLWSLTNSPYPDDFAVFSPDRRYVVFQSTRDSDAAIYLMPALGGTITRLTPRGGQFSIVGWKNQAAATYVDRFRVLGPSSAAVGDSISISLLGVDPNGLSRIPADVPLRLLDPRIARLHGAPDSAESHHFTLQTLEAGTARIVASIPGWREDTLSVRIGGGRQGELSDDFAAGISPDRWSTFGDPLPQVRRDSDGVMSLFPNADLQWQSGVMSRDVVSLRNKLEVGAVFAAPFGGRALPGALLDLSLVAETRDEVNRVAPQFTEYATIAWDGEAGRFVYSVGAESKSDPVAALRPSTTHSVRISIDEAGNASFSVDGMTRWTSSLRFLGGLSEPRAHVWLGGKATGSWGRIRDLTVRQSSR